MLVGEAPQRERGLDHESARWAGRMVGGFFQDGSSKDLPITAGQPGGRSRSGIHPTGCGQCAVG